MVGFAAAVSDNLRPLFIIAHMVSITEVILWLAPTGILLAVLIVVLANLATRRTDTAEYRRLSERVRLLEADHHADLAQITSFREEVFYLGRLISMLAALIESAGMELPNEVEQYMRRRRVYRPLPADPDLAIMVQHALQQFFSLDELQQLAFEMGVECDNLPGATKERKARELVLFLDRRGQMELLVQTIREMRPNIPLPWLGGRDPP